MLPSKFAIPDYVLDQVFFIYDALAEPYTNEP